MSNDILDAIDGALEDWSTSGDAMRWVPEGERLTPPEPPGWRTPTASPTMAELLAIARGESGARPIAGLYVAPAGSPPESDAWRQVEGVINVTPDGPGRWTIDTAVTAALRAAWRAQQAVMPLDEAFDAPRRGRHWRPGRPRRYRPPEWLRYPGDGDLARWPHLSGVCTGWLCDSCTDPDCAHTCHGGHLAMSGPISPDCRNAPFKCGACSGDAWDEETDTPAPCACPCHREDHT